ncbi:MAG: NUDIX hydrolase [Gemmatimonadota bacterium]
MTDPTSMPEPAAGAPESGRLDSRPVYDGRIVRLSLDKVRFPDGSTGELEMIRHPGAAAILPVLGRPEGADPEVLLLRQYRYAAGGFIYEVPAGLPRGPEESWEACARRELEEETGFRAGGIREMTRIFTTPGFTDEEIHLFVAWDLQEGRTNLDDDEFVEVLHLPFSRVVEMVRTGEIVDGKTVATVLYAAAFVLGK